MPSAKHGLIDIGLIPLASNRLHTTPIYLIESKGDVPPYIAQEHVNYATRLGFFESKNPLCILPSEDGQISSVLIKFKSTDRFEIGHLISTLPNGEYAIETSLPEPDFFDLCLGFCLSCYRFDRYKSKKVTNKVKLHVPNESIRKKVETFSKAEYFVRDLINTPACDLSPDIFEKTITNFANKFKAETKTIVGKKLLEENFPLIYSVGAASENEPRLIEFKWGKSQSFKLTLVGKGVCFDTGGLNIKPGRSMSLMKKDMGGAASVLGLAYCIMALGLDVSLRVIIPIVENSISSNSLRPGDILYSRKGYSVEINNTDAEGRLLLADALSYAEEENPDLIICMATLTGAARTALGPEITPFYTDNDDLARSLLISSEKAFDPVWRMPFYTPYEYLIESKTGDLDNAPETPMAGSITAALFLRKFIDKKQSFIHFDTFAWSIKQKPGRPIGGSMQAVRALYMFLEEQQETTKRVTS